MKLNRKEVTFAGVPGCGTIQLLLNSDEVEAAVSQAWEALETVADEVTRPQGDPMLYFHTRSTGQRPWWTWRPPHSESDWHLPQCSPARLRLYVDQPTFRLGNLEVAIDLLNLGNELQLPADLVTSNLVMMVLVSVTDQDRRAYRQGILKTGLPATIEHLCSTFRPNMGCGGRPTYLRLLLNSLEEKQRAAPRPDLGNTFFPFMVLPTSKLSSLAIGDIERVFDARIDWNNGYSWLQVTPGFDGDPDHRSAAELLGLYPVQYFQAERPAIPWPPKQSAESSSSKEVELQQVDETRERVEDAISRGQFQEAEHTCRQRLAELESRFGPEDERLAFWLSNLGIVLRDEDFSAAEQAARRAVAISATAFGTGHLEHASDLAALAYVVTVRDLEQAEAHYLQALDIFENHYPDGESGYAAAMHNYATVLDEAGRYNDAIAAYGRAAQLILRSNEDSKRDLKPVLESLARCFLQNGGQESDYPKLLRTLLGGDDHHEQ